MKFKWTDDVAGSSSTLINAAQGKWAWQSSVNDNAVASLAIDGNENPNYVAGSCSHTRSGEGYPVWGLDLEVVRDVHYVEALNRDWAGQYKLVLLDIRDIWGYIDGSVKKRCNPSALAMVLYIVCIKTSILNSVIKPTKTCSDFCTSISV